MTDIFSFSGKNILLSPLNWGLGHASRMVPVIKRLRTCNNVVVVCAKEAEQFLKSEIPDINIIIINELSFKYPESRISLFSLLRLAFIMLFNSLNEHYKVKKLIKQFDIQIVVSDNRYGLLYKNIPCYIFTHQIFPFPPHPFEKFQNLFGKILIKYLSKFTKCIIPDFTGDFKLSGLLTQKLPLDSRKFVYSGILSRFEDAENVDLKKRYDYLVLISGIEKQRTVFENEILKKFSDTQKKVLFVRGVFAETLPEKFNDISPSVTVKNYLTGNELKTAFLESETVICRSGYSTLCDLIALNKKAEVYPTPGQTEQEYLAERLKNINLPASIHFSIIK